MFPISNFKIHIQLNDKMLNGNFYEVLIFPTFVLYVILQNSSVSQDMKRHIVYFLDMCRKMVEGNNIYRQHTTWRISYC